MPTTGMLGVPTDTKKCTLLPSSPYKTGKTGKSGKENDKAELTIDDFGLEWITTAAAPRRCGSGFWKRTAMTASNGGSMSALPERKQPDGGV